MERNCAAGEQAYFVNDQRRDVNADLAVRCANISNLILARFTRRSPEFAVRAALGASRARKRRGLRFAASV